MTKLGVTSIVMLLGAADGSTSVACSFDSRVNAPRQGWRQDSGVWGAGLSGCSRELETNLWMACLAIARIERKAEACRTLQCGPPVLSQNCSQALR